MFMPKVRRCRYTHNTKRAAERPRAARIMPVLAADGRERVPASGCFRHYGRTYVLARREPRVGQDGGIKDDRIKLADKRNEGKLSVARRAGRRRERCAGTGIEEKEVIAKTAGDNHEAEDEDEGAAGHRQLITEANKYGLSQRMNTRPYLIA